MKNIFLGAFALLSMAASASGGAIIRFPKPFLVCTETPLNDGYRQLVIEKDRFEELSAKLQTHDFFGEEKVIAEYVEVEALIVDGPGAQDGPMYSYSGKEPNNQNKSFHVLVRDINGGNSVGKFELFKYRNYESFNVSCEFANE